MVKYLPVAVLGAALLTPVPAHAAFECVETSSTNLCVVAADDDRYACTWASVDPSEHTVDDVVSGYVCLADQGSGLEVFSCFAWARRYFLCSR